MNDRLSRLTSGLGAGRPNSPQAGNPPASARPPLSAPGALGGNPVGRKCLGRYQILNLLGEGAMGKVYLARSDDGTKVVVKLMHESVAKQPKFLELFEREMGFMARFQHPNVVALHEASSRDPLGPCIVMEYVAGTDLEQLLKKQRRFPVDRVGRLLGQLCSALQAAHQEGIIHRDLKPANLMVVEPDTPQEQIKVMDFGLAKLSNAPHLRLEQLRGDRQDVATGTPEYMAAEQARGDEVDHRADIYSVGVILYEMLTGRLPFIRKSIPELLHAHSDDPPPTFRAAGAIGVVSPSIEAVVMACLLKYPNERPQSAWELAERFEKALGQKILQGVAAPPPPKPKQAAAPALAKPTDPNATVYELDAWMPEKIAIIKIRGFVDDAGGEVTASEPGLIRVVLGGPRCKYQVASAAPVKRGWFSSAPAATNLIEMELHMQKGDSGGQGQLHVMLVLKPAAGSSVRKTSPDWQTFCDRVNHDLRGYLICK